MTERKYTDEEIIKALETAIKIGDAPIGEHWACTISKQTAKDALDLIKRQNEEIERLRAENEEMKKNERWLGAKLYIVIEGLGEAFVSGETVTAIGRDRLWVSGCVPPGDDAGCEVPFSEIGRSAFWSREEAEERLREVLEK